jgi:chromosome segregation ATPase
MRLYPVSPVDDDSGNAKQQPVALNASEEQSSPGSSSLAGLISRMDELVAYFAGQNSQASSRSSEPHPGAGLEARLAHLEASTAHLQRDVAQIRTDVRDIRERLHRLQERATHLPSKGLLVFSVALVLAGVGAAAAFQQQIQSLARAVF